MKTFSVTISVGYALY